MKLTRELVKKSLTHVYDPEIGISIVDMGLVYGIDIDQSGGVKITMTLTTPGCPLIDLIQTDVKSKIKALGVKEKDIKIEVTFDPPWSMDKMTEKGKKQLGF